jgi:transcription termination factor NusB
LYAIDSKLLEVSTSKLEMVKKTIIRKAIIELENMNREGKNVIT